MCYPDESTYCIQLCYFSTYESLKIHMLINTRTADIVVNSPRFRRKSSTFVDAIHDLPEKADLAPAQLYSTESGRLFHSGRIVIITVGLPARGKTFVKPYFLWIFSLFLKVIADILRVILRHMSVALARYLRWSVHHSTLV